MYSSITGNIKVTVEPTYLSAESEPEQNVYVWAYKVRIENNGSETVQLKSRHWKITDSYGRVHEVQGPGVVGEQPVLAPGDMYEYTSGTPLSTPSGIMAGTYAMENPEGAKLTVEIPAFSLHTPEMVRAVN